MAAQSSHLQSSISLDNCEMDCAMNALAPNSSASRTITVFGNSMLPLYGHGDRLIVSDGVPIALGDRIVIEAQSLGVIGGVLIYRDEKGIAVTLGGNRRREVLVDPADVKFLARVLWASQ